MQLHECSRESGSKEAYKSIYILPRYARFPGGCDLAVDRKCAFGATKVDLLQFIPANGSQRGYLVYK